MLTWVVRGVLTLALMTVLVVVGALGYRDWRQGEVAKHMAITTPDGVSQSEYLSVGGIDQFVDFRGDHKSNPVLLIVAGGPGNSLVLLEALFRPWEKYFTIVEWDQPGAGKTYVENGPAHQGSMTIDQYTQDGLAVAAYARLLLHKDKIVVLGASWGSIVALRMVKAHPGMFSAYVGTGQVVASGPQEAYNFDAVMRKARAAGDTSAVAKLNAIGPPPYKSLEDILVERKLGQKYDTDAERGIFWSLAPIVLTAPNVTLSEIYASQTSGTFAAKALIKEIEAYDAHALGTDFQVPIFILNGDHDTITPMPLSKAWFDALKAPEKTYVVLPGGGHDAMLTMPDAFLNALRTRVWSVANAADMVMTPPSKLDE